MPTVEIEPERARDSLAAAGATIESGNTEYERWRASLGEATAVAYDDKVVVQGARPTDILGVLAPYGGHVHVYFDGASRGNPGRAAIGWVLVTDEGIIDEGGEYIGEATNNEAEYEAIIRGLEAAAALGFDEAEVRGDSELIVRQVRGEYDVNVPRLRELRIRVLELLEQFDDWTLEAVPRGVNERADRLANEVLDARG